MMYHTDPQASVWLYHVLSYTSLCVNRKECKHLASASFRCICLGVFSEWETEKGELLRNISFCLYIGIDEQKLLV